MVDVLVCLFSGLSGSTIFHRGGRHGKSNVNLRLLCENYTKLKYYFFINRKYSLTVTD